MRKEFDDWQRLNPVLATGEVGEIEGMSITKTGDGVTPWRELSYTQPAAYSYSVSFPEIVDARFDNGASRPDALVVIWVAANGATPTNADPNLDIVKNAPAA